jgi:TonB family protein
MSQRNERSRQPGLDGITHWLIQRAAHRAPESLSPRLEEEWLADLEARFSAWSRLRFAAGCCWASLVIVNDFPRHQVAAAGPAVSAGGLVTLTDRNFGYFSLRSATLFLIAGLHAALFYGMITTLSHTRGSTPPSVLEYQVLKHVPRETVPLPLPDTQLKEWTINVPKLVIDAPRKIDVESDLPAQGEEKSAESYAPLPQVPQTPTHNVSHVTGGPGAGFPETADYYPSSSIRLEEEGYSAVRVCVDAKGRLSSAPSIVQSSGSARLDEGALRLARAGSGHYRASTEDGQPANSCYPFGVRFQLKR